MSTTASGIDGGKVLGVLALMGAAALVLWFLFAVLGGSSRGGSGQRDLANAQRDMSRAIEAVRSAHAQRMYAERAAQPARVARVHALVEERRAREHGRWLSENEAREELTHA